MPRPPEKRHLPPRETTSRAKTWLAYYRNDRGMTQRELARAAGIPLETYRRLERGQIKNPRVRHVMNCAIVLDCDWWDVWERDWREWYPLPGGPKAPPRNPETLHDSARFKPKKPPKLPAWD